MGRLHIERHGVERIGWLRAAVLGANDGIVSTASLIVGIAAAAATKDSIMVTAMAGLVAGAMSMAAGEYVSVSSQADSEKADRLREEKELRDQPDAERQELIAIYVARGLDENLAAQVTDAMMAKDPLAAHLRDELGQSAHLEARPVQAALSSAGAFAIGAALPMAVASLFAVESLPMAVSIASLVFLALLGAIGARAGGAPMVPAVVRVTFWGALAMLVTALIGSLFGATVA